MQNEPIEVTLKVTGIFEKLGVPYLIGGSLARVHFFKLNLPAPKSRPLLSKQKSAQNLPAPKTPSFPNLNGIVWELKFQTVSGATSSA